MKLLHTSDWHLGRHLYGRKREAEFQAFLDWLLLTLEQESIDVLVVAGDVFDTSAPSHQAQTLYYQFLNQVARTGCRHVVVIAGNHDSPSFINAPQQLLSALDIHVIGHACTQIEDEVLLLKNKDHVVELIVCAVPYLRDKDIRTVGAGESVDDKAQKLLEGLQIHYDAVAAVAVAYQKQLPAPVPIVATGHLFTAGGQVQDGDGVRDLYVGTLGHFSAARFPQVFDYVALGHLHVPQRVADLDHVRYCGSPIPMGFGEAKQQKQVLIAEFTQQQRLSVQAIPIPTFQALAQIRGSWTEIEQQLTQWVDAQSSVWVEVMYTGDELISDLSERIKQLVVDSNVEVLRIQNHRIKQQVLHATTPTESLDELEPMDVFVRCLDSHQIPDTQRAELVAAFLEILTEHHES